MECYTSSSSVDGHQGSEDDNFKADSDEHYESSELGDEDYASDEKHRKTSQATSNETVLKPMLRCKADANFVRFEAI